MVSETTGETTRATSTSATNPGEVSGSFRRDIQGLRAIAVLLVALGHARIARLGGGYIGVDVFFVLSGFLITGLLIRRSERAGHLSFRDFYAARARRILPAATLTLAVTAIAARVLLNFVRAREALHDTLWANFFLANVRFSRVGTDYFASTAPPPVQHFWSLAVEEQFYLVFPALVMLVMIAPRRRDLRASGAHNTPAKTRLVVALSVVVLVSLTYSISYTSTNHIAAYFSPFTRAWELGIGAIVAVTATPLSRIPGGVRSLLGWCGLAGVLTSALLYNSATDFPGSAALLPVTATALIIVAGLGGGHHLGVGRVLEFSPLGFVGDVSYSFYLWHWPVLVLAAGYSGHALSVGRNLALLAGAFVLAVITYKLVEHPLHRGSTLRAPRRALAIWPLAIATVLTVVAIEFRSIHAEVGSERSSPADLSALPVRTLGPLLAASTTPQRLAQPIPKKLIPPVAHLDDGMYEEGHCGPGPGDRTTADICRLGDRKARRTMVVFGDSHSRMWMPQLLHFARVEHWMLVPLFKERCVAAVFRQGNGDAADLCHRWFDWVLGQLPRLRPDVILIGQSYARASLGPVGAKTSIRGMADEVGIMMSMAKDVIVLEDVPYLERDPVDCILEGGATLGTCTFRPSRIFLTADATIARNAKDGGAVFLPTRQWFCTKRWCPTIVGRTIAYRDQGHVSPAYANQLQPAFDRELHRALAAASGSPG